MSVMWVKKSHSDFNHLYVNIMCVMFHEILDTGNCSYIRMFLHPLPNSKLSQSLTSCPFYSLQGWGCYINGILTECNYPTIAFYTWCNPSKLCIFYYLILFITEQYSLVWMRHNLLVCSPVQRLLRL